MERDQIKILVVDDEDPLRMTIVAMLRQAGYCDVVAAQDGRAALELIEQSQLRVSLVITDIRMPGMDGAELTTRIRQLYPDIKVLCMSGFADPMSPNGHYFLAKPFTSNALIAAVHHVLELQPATGRDCD